MIIAHRPETIASADRVLEVQGNRIVQVPGPEPLGKLAGDPLPAAAF